MTVKRSLSVLLSALALMWLISVLLTIPWKVLAQNPGPVYVTFTNPNGNACGSQVLWIYGPSGALYTCQNGTVAVVSGGGGGGTGTVTEVKIQGTSNQTAVSGTCDITTSGTCTIGFAATPTLPNGTTATSQPQNDNSTKPATTAYTDLAVANALAGTNPAVAVLAASTANIVGTYSNGTAGVGATFTVTAMGAYTLDGISISTIGQRVLLKDQSSAFQNGVYTSTDQAGTSPVACEVLNFSGTGLIDEIVTVPFFSPNTPLWINVGNAGVVSSPCSAAAPWTGWAAVYHLNEASAAPTFADSTGDTSGTAHNAITNELGKVGGSAQNFGTSGYIQIAPNSTINATTTLRLSAITINATSGPTAIQRTNNYGMAIAGGSMNATWNTGTENTKLVAPTATYDPSFWHQWVSCVSGGVLTGLYKDGVLVASTPANVSAVNRDTTQNLFWGGANVYGLNEMRIITGSLAGPTGACSPAWLYTEAQNTLFNNSTFNANQSFTLGPELPAAAPATSEVVLLGTYGGTAGSYMSNGNVVTNVGDGNLWTYWDCPNSSGCYISIDMGAGNTPVPTRIRFATKPGDASQSLTDPKAYLTVTQPTSASNPMSSILGASSTANCGTATGTPLQALAPWPNWQQLQWNILTVNAHGTGYQVFCYEATPYTAPGGAIAEIQVLGQDGSGANSQPVEPVIACGRQDVPTWGGNYPSGSIVCKLSTTTTGSTNIYYTTDGSVPTNASTLYTGPWQLHWTCPDGGMMLRAVAYKASLSTPTSYISNAFFGCGLTPGVTSNVVTDTTKSYITMSTPSFLPVVGDQISSTDVPVYTQVQSVTSLAGTTTVNLMTNVNQTVGTYASVNASVSSGSVGANFTPRYWDQFGNVIAGTDANIYVENGACYLPLQNTNIYSINNYWAFPSVKLYWDPNCSGYTGDAMNWSYLGMILDSGTYQYSGAGGTSGLGTEGPTMIRNDAGAHIIWATDWAAGRPSVAWCGSVTGPCTWYGIGVTGIGDFSNAYNFPGVDCGIVSSFSSGINTFPFNRSTPAAITDCTWPGSSPSGTLVYNNSQPHPREGGPGMFMRANEIFMLSVVSNPYGNGNQYAGYSTATSAYGTWTPNGATPPTDLYASDPTSGVFAAGTIRPFSMPFRVDAAGYPAVAAIMQLWNFPPQLRSATISPQPLVFGSTTSVQAQTINQWDWSYWKWIFPVSNIGGLADSGDGVF